MQRSVRTLLFTALAIATVLPVAAQRREDPRTMTPPTSVRVPLIPAPNLSILQGKRSLASGATYVGRATLEPYTPLAQGVAQSTTPFTSHLPAPLHIERADNGTVAWIAGRLGDMATYAGRGEKYMHRLAGIASTDRPAVATTLALMQEYATTLHLHNPTAELAPMSIGTDDLSYQHVRFQQVFQGIPIWGSDLYVHINQGGEIYLINGRYQPTPTELSTTPVLSGTSAIDRVITDLKDRNRWDPLPEDAARLLDIGKPASHLVFYPDGHQLHLAYEVTLHPNLLEHYLYIVDATDGRILNKIAQHCSLQNHDQPAGAAHIIGGDQSEEGTSAAGFVDASGTDLNGATQSFRAYQHTNGSYYMAWDLANFKQAGSTLPDQLDGGALTISANNNDLNEQTQLRHVLSSNNSWTDPSAISAHANMKRAYTYYNSTFGRKAINDQDQSMISVVHVTSDGQPMDNAFWNGRFMAYGDGASSFKPLAGGLDVAGHEMTHGVVENSAALIYQYQAGALNESFADVFGLMVDREDFLMGEDIMRPGHGPALRDMENPDNPQLEQPQPAHMNQFNNLTADQDNGGVHINSGIPNKAAVLIIKSIGHEKAEQIYYRALTKYLTRNSQFIDARNAVEQAAKDLYGDGAEAAAVRNGFAAVGIGAGTGTNPDNNDVPPVTPLKTLIAFVTASGQIGYLDVATQQAFTFNHPKAIARVSQNQDIAQLSTGRSGQNLWFVNQQGQMAFINLTSGEVFELTSHSIQQPGDIWNMSISPDETVAALVSAYQNDAHIYFADDQHVFNQIELKPESSQNGIKIETIKYPDVIVFSPNTNIPRIGFDAFNEVPVAGTSSSYWGMYEIDFDAKRIYSLLPVQPEGISVGNLTYSKTDPDIIAFNVVEDGISDIYLGDFEQGQVVGFGVPNFTVGGFPITDAQRPTFAHDDSYLAFTSPSLQSMLFYSFGADQLTFLTLPQAVYNPHWFAIAAPASITERSGMSTGIQLSGVTPNPVSNQATINYSLARRGHVQMELIDALGREVVTLLDAEQDAGHHQVMLDAGKLSSGMYMVRLQTGESVTTGTIRVVH